MIHLIEDSDVQIAELARHPEGDDLTPAVGENLAAAGEAVEDEVDGLVCIALLEQIGALAHRPHPGQERVQHRRSCSERTPYLSSFLIKACCITPQRVGGTSVLRRDSDIRLNK